MEAARGILNSHWVMRHVEIEDHASVTVSGPGHKAFIVALNQPDHAIDHVGMLAAQGLCGLVHEINESGTRHVNFRNHLRGRDANVHPAVDLFMVVVKIVAEELRIRPVDLACRRRISLAVDFKGAALIDMHVIGELGPVLGTEARCMLGDGSAVWHRLIAGEDAAMKEAGARAVDGALEVTVKITVADALLKAIRNIFEVADLHDPAHLYAAAQPELDGGDESEHAVTANRQAKKFRVGLPAAFAEFAVGVKQGEGFHVADNGLVVEHAPVAV